LISTCLFKLSFSFHENRLDFGAEPFLCHASLAKELKEHTALEEDFVSFRFIATADQVRNLPRNQTFLVVQRWRDRPDAEEVLVALKKRGWQSITLADLILS